MAFNRFKVALNRWRLAFAAFALVYLIILLVEMTQHPIQWDEVIHLNAGSYLYFGNYGAFVQNAFYPPLFDGVILLSFKTLGVSLFAARAVPVLFSVLSLWLVFELANSMYNGKTALLSAVVLAVMPGYFWLSQGALLETASVFFVVASLLFFYRWLATRKDRNLVFTGVALGLGLFGEVSGGRRRRNPLGQHPVFSSKPTQAGLQEIHDNHRSRNPSSRPMDSHRLPDVRFAAPQPMGLRAPSRQPRTQHLQRPLPTTHLLPNRHGLALRQHPPHLNIHLHRRLSGASLSCVEA